MNGDASIHRERELPEWFDEYQSDMNYTWP